MTPYEADALRALLAAAGAAYRTLLREAHSVEGKNVADNLLAARLRATAMLYTEDLAFEEVISLWTSTPPMA
jgi:hypothetical protein